MKEILLKAFKHLGLTILSLYLIGCLVLGFFISEINLDQYSFIVALYYIPLLVMVPFGIFFTLDGGF